LKRSSREEAGTIETLLAEGRRGDALRQFLTGTGMPPEMVDQMSGAPATVAMAPTLAYDFAVLGYAGRGGTIPEDLARSTPMPTLVIHGTASPAFIHDTATRIASLLPNGRHTVLEGQDHFVPPEVLAPVLAEFFAG
jgi:pimeloyl-ACP methyl ester carboxylesterase